jgi:putative tricarboxylic transport membrane protein
MNKRSTLRFGAAALAAAGLVAFGPLAAAAEPARPECVAPAKPGGGFDLTCRLAQSALRDSGALKSPLRIVYMPGGIGAVAYNNISTWRRASSASTRSTTCAGWPRSAPTTAWPWCATTRHTRI